MPSSLTKQSLCRQHKTRKTNEGHKIKIINHLNESFQTAFSNQPDQCIDEYMKKFKRRSYFLSKQHQVLQQWHEWYRYNRSKNSCLQT